MKDEKVLANLNLYAVLQNLEELVQYDAEMARLSKDWHISIQFKVRGGPKAFIEFQNGTCRVVRGKHDHPVVKLFFNSPAHLNRMFEGKGNPIPLKGFTKLGFLNNQFSKLTTRLEYYLKPTDELLRDRTYLELNTRFTLNTAAFAVKELASLDPVGKLIAPHLGNGRILMKILPHGPSVHLDSVDGEITVKKGGTERPMACMFMRDVRIANDFLNGKMDPFTAVCSGAVLIRGQLPMLDSISLILDRIPHYLS